VRASGGAGVVGGWTTFHSSGVGAPEDVPFQLNEDYFDFAEKMPAKAKQRISNEHMMTPIHLTWRKSGRE
jgi:hypothetical protein